MSAPTIGLAIIARDEEKQLPRLLASIEGAFDQVVLLDTGSEDRTVKVFEDWVAAEAERQPHFRARIDSFTWRDDFAAARAAADELLDTDWNVWADCDDELRNATALRGVAAQLAPDVMGAIFGYEYIHDQHGNVACYLKRERLVRRGAGRWAGRVHEAQTIEGILTDVPPDIACWIHRPLAGKPDSNERNRRILTAWLEDEPDNPRVLGYLGTEELVRGEPANALPFFEKYLSLKTGWDEERAQVHRKYASALIAVERHDEAIATAFDALRVVPSWPDSHLTLAEAHYALGEHEKAVHWAREVLRMGIPDTLLIINPLDYVFQPQLIIAGALGAAGQLDDAIEAAEAGLQLIPDHPGLREGLATWRGVRKREQTAQTWLAAAEMLVNHDEQLKALDLLEATVPYYAQDHPRVVALRSQLRERLTPLADADAYAQIYAAGGHAAEAPVPDDKVVEFASRLPRAQFLREGIRDQLEAVAA